MSSYLGYTEFHGLTPTVRQLANGLTSRGRGTSRTRGTNI